MSRIAALDRLRGLSILGILLVNAIAFAQPMEVYDNPGLLDLSAADWRVWTLTQVFCRDKFITAFTLLFGISAFLVGQEGSDNKVLMRRLLWLGVFGLIHGALIWHGDVLLIYAVTGLLFRRWLHAPWRRLLVWGLALFIAGAVFANWHRDIAAMLDPADIMRMKIGFWESLRGNFDVWARSIVPEILTYLPVTLGGMMIGLALFKAGFFTEASTRVHAGVIAAAGLSLGLIALMPHNPMVNAVLCLPVALGYASLLILVEQTRWGGAWLYPLACAGRLAFTNYIVQSIVMTVIFYGGRGPGLYGTFAYAQLLPIVLAIWVAQLLFGVVWLQWFRYGPFEWLWRRLTLGHPVPMRHQLEQA